jgi:hypothetical protein
MNNLKPAGIPLFVTAYGALLAVMGIALGVMGLLNPASAVGFIENAEMLAGAWAGRTLGLGLITAFALWFRSAPAYVMAFVGCCFREFGDVVGAINSGSSGMVAVLLGFLAVDIICLILSARAMMMQRRNRDL